MGPWFFDPWLATAREQGFDLRYVVLMPGSGDRRRARMRPHRARRATLDAAQFRLVGP